MSRCDLQWSWIRTFAGDSANKLMSVVAELDTTPCVPRRDPIAPLDILSKAHVDGRLIPALKNAGVKSSTRFAKIISISATLDLSTCSIDDLLFVPGLPVAVINQFLDTRAAL